MRKISLIAFTVLISFQILAQVPSYVPTNGLVGWWPFTGNAIDSSGNGNHGTVNGATLTTDRFGNSNMAYSFDGVNDWIEVLHKASLNLPNGSINIWFKTNSNNRMTLLNKSVFNGASNENYTLFLGYLFPAGPTGIGYFSKYNSNCMPSNGWNGPVNSLNYSDQLYHMLTCITSSAEIKIYVDGILKASSIAPSTIADTCSNSNLRFGRNHAADLSYFSGDIDDIGIWNRALTECEILDLYNSQLGSFKNTPINVNPPSSVIGTSAVFTSLKPLQAIQWQSNSNEIGWVNLPNNSKYNGVTNDTLVVSNLQVSNHNQAFRAIACSDTSNIAYVKITDTCITKVNDTIKVTKYDTIKVTDTLVINATLSGVSAPNNTNRLIIYPNPAKDHITIDYGVFSRMNGYTLKIVNTLGQTVFSTPINQQTSYINLSTWTGKGMYYVQIYDASNTMTENRKIVLQ